MRIQTIYPAFMGEVNKFGIGAPCVFVRTAGCNLRCYWRTLGIMCDTPEALDIHSGEEMPVDEIVTKVVQYDHRLVCLTGGEPLLQSERELKQLFKLLGDCGISVVVETNGSRSINPFLGFENVSFVVDYKGFSTGENQSMSIGNWTIMREDDWLKFVIYNRSDINEMIWWCERNRPEFKGKIAAGLFWGTPMVKYGALQTGETRNPVDFGLLQHIIVEHPDLDIHLNMQAHKMVCLYDANLEVVQKIVAPKDL